MEWVVAATEQWDGSEKTEGAEKRSRKLLCGYTCEEWIMMPSLKSKSTLVLSNISVIAIPIESLIDTRYAFNLISIFSVLMCFM